MHFQDERRNAAALKLSADWARSRVNGVTGPEDVAQQTLLRLLIQDGSLTEESYGQDEPASSSEMSLPDDEDPNASLRARWEDRRDRALAEERQRPYIPSSVEQHAPALVLTVAHGLLVDIYRAAGRRPTSSLDELVERRGDACAGKTVGEDPAVILERRDDDHEKLAPMQAFRQRLMRRPGGDGQTIYEGLVHGLTYQEVVENVSRAHPESGLTPVALRRLVYLACRQDPELRRWLRRREAPADAVGRGGGSHSAMHGRLEG